MPKKRLMRAELPDTTLDPGKVLYCVHRYYCDVMNRRGQCPNNCTACKSEIGGILSQIDLDKARNPYAVLTWLLREHMAEKAEQQEQRAIPKKDWLEQPVEVNIFALALDEMQL